MTWVLRGGVRRWVGEFPEPSVADLATHDLATQGKFAYWVGQLNNGKVVKARAVAHQRRTARSRV